MKRRGIRYHRRHCGIKKLVVIGVIFFIVGYGLSVLYNNGGHKSSNLSFLNVCKSLFFFANDVSELKGVSQDLPKLSDWEGHSSLKSWEIGYEENSGEMVPVFLSYTVDEDGKEISTSAALVASKSETAEIKEKDAVKVLIYCTHTSEGYGGGGDVTDVAERLVKTLSLYGVKAVFDDTPHDEGSWYMCYTNSRATAQSMMTKYPDYDLIIDLHRDSGPDKDSTTAVTADGKDFARLLLIVGSNMKWTHPNWELNETLANNIADYIQVTNKDALLGVRVQTGRYNQDLTPKAMLLEIGTELNTLSEAKRGADIFAKAVVSYLNSDNKKKFKESDS